MAVAAAVAVTPQKIAGMVLTKKNAHTFWRCFSSQFSDGRRFISCPVVAVEGVSRRKANKKDGVEKRNLEIYMGFWPFFRSGKRPILGTWGERRGGGLDAGTTPPKGHAT